MVDTPYPSDERLVPEPPPKDRSEYERDRDRVLYSSAFARLAGVTQVATTPPGQGFHNRLTHTLKVGQLSSRLTKKLQARYPNIDAVSNLDQDATEAAALGHDLGHPPFGHVGEEVLAELADGAGGFEANAQSFRIITRLANRSLAFEGLNLTRLSLDGMLKYPWLRAPESEGDTLPRRKWGAYDEESSFLNFARARKLDAPAIRSDVESKPSLTAQIIDWADDVTYAIHDLEDFYKAGVIPVQDLVWRRDEREAFAKSFFDGEGTLRPKFHDLLDPDYLDQGMDSLRALFAMSLFGPYDHTRETRARLRRASSFLIGQYFEAVEIRTDSSGRPVVRMTDESLIAEIVILKELLWFYVINRPGFASMQHGQRRILRGLFEMLSIAAEHRREWRMFPPPVQEAIRVGPGDSGDVTAREQRSRIIVDYISSMTQLETVNLYRVLSGENLNSAIPRMTY